VLKDWTDWVKKFSVLSGNIFLHKKYETG